MDTSLLLAFSASFFLIALSPGMCMTLAMSLGISLGVRRTLWMMAGELVGVGMVGTAAVLGVATLLLQAPIVFTLFKFIGGAYLLYLGWQSWHAPPPTQLSTQVLRRRRSLALQGFITAIANPKAWAFFVALLPPFIDQQQPLAPQLLSLLSLMLIIEFICLLIYAQGGRALSTQLFKRGKARWLNRLSGILMMTVGCWLALS